MFRTLLTAATLLTASGTALAHDVQVYGRVIRVEPSLSVSFGSGHHDGFRVLYESGGHHYWTHTSYHPGHTIVLPPHHLVNVHHHGDHGWHKRRHWDDDDDHPGRGHGRHHRKHHRFGHDD